MMYSKIPRTVRIKKVLDEMNKHSSCEFNNQIIKKTNELKKKHYNKDLVVLHTGIYFDMIFDKHNTKNDVNLLFEDMYGAYYDDDMKLHEDFTCNIIDKFTI